jgi:hypothetical protein
MIEVLENRMAPATLAVHNNFDSGPGSLRDTIAAAASGDTIVFDSSVHAITLTSGELAISKSLNIDGPGAGLLNISGDGLSRIFHTGGAVTVSLSGMTITDGYTVVATFFSPDGGGGILNEAGSTLILDHCVLSKNVVTTAPNSGLDVVGGGLLNKGTAKLQNTVVDSNKALGGGSYTALGGSAGGGIDNYEGGTLTLTDSAVTNNAAISAANPPGATASYFALGGGIDNHGGFLNSNPSTLTINHSTISNNLATGGDGVQINGGGILNANEMFNAQFNLAVITINDSTINGNRAVGGNNGNGSTTQFSAALGGAIISVFATLTLNNTTLNGNQAIGGNNVTPVIGGVASPASGGGQGGGIVNAEGLLTISNCKFIGNQAIGGNTTTGQGAIANGGAITTWGTGLGPVQGVTKVDGSTFVNNQAIAGKGASSAPSTWGFATGGAFDVAFSATATVTSSTFIGNQATGSSGPIGGTGLGGAICLGFSALFSTASQPVVDNATLQMTGCGFKANTAQGGTGSANAGPALGGALAIDPGCAATVNNSIFLSNVVNGGQNSSAQANGGGGIDNAGTLTLSNSSLVGNQAVTTNGSDSLGGGLLNNEGKATIQGTTFSNNAALGGGSTSLFSGSAGGAIDNYEGATLNVTGSTFTGNQVVSAPGGFHFGVGGAIESDAGAINNNPSTVTISNSTFTNNVATGGTDVIGQGGAIGSESLVPGLSLVNLTNCTIIGNRAVGGGGGDGVTVTDSEATGGALQQYQGTMNIAGCAISGNLAQGGNGTVISNADPGAGGAFGGGIQNNFLGVLNISNSTLAGNVAQGGSTAAGPGSVAVGGGITNSPGATMTMTNCVVSNNSALAGKGGPGANSLLTLPGGYAFGGGVDTSRSGSSSTITGSTITLNRAAGSAGAGGNAGGNGYGGGLSVGFGTLFGDTTDGATLTLLNSYVDGNIAMGGAGGLGANGGNGEGGGLYVGATASATVTSSTFAFNLAIGGSGGAGANGGDGLGAGLYIAAKGSATLNDARIVLNKAIGGLHGTGGSNGKGIGGGVYNLGTLSEDLLTVIAFNLASTSNNDVFP